MKTKDIGIITTLKTLGYNWTKIDETDPTEVWFEYDEEAAKIATGYYAGEQWSFSPLDFVENIKRIKSLLYYIKNKNANKRHNYR